MQGGKELLLFRLTQNLKPLLLMLVDDWAKSVRGLPSLGSAQGLRNEFSYVSHLKSVSLFATHPLAHVSECAIVLQ